MKETSHRYRLRNSILIDGDVTGNVQNLHDGATAVTSQAIVVSDQYDVASLIDELRKLLALSRQAGSDVVEYQAALQAIETGATDPQQHRFSIKGALQVLKGAAGMVAGWAEAVTALQHALKGL